MKFLEFLAGVAGRVVGTIEATLQVVRDGIWGKE